MQTDRTRSTMLFKGGCTPPMLQTSGIIGNPRRNIKKPAGIWRRYCPVRVEPNSIPLSMDRLVSAASGVNGYPMWNTCSAGSSLTRLDNVRGSNVGWAFTGPLTELFVILVSKPSTVEGFFRRLYVADIWKNAAFRENKKRGHPKSSSLLWRQNGTCCWRTWLR
jgi:hypothetical protein